MCIFFQQTSLTCDTDAVLSNMKEIEGVVKEDHHSLVTHVCKHFFNIFAYVISSQPLCDYPVNAV